MTATPDASFFDGSNTKSFSPTVKIRPYVAKNYSDMAIQQMLLDAQESGDALESVHKSVFRNGNHYPPIATLNADKRLIVKLLFHDMHSAP